MGKLAVTIEGYTYEIELDLVPQTGSQFTVIVDGEQVEVTVPDLEALVQDMEWMVIGDRPYEIVVDPDLRWIKSAFGIYPLEIDDLEAVTQRPPVGDGRIKAPIPGQVTRLMVSEGDEVGIGQPLFILEAMKMENEIRSPRTGVVKTLNIKPGQGVLLHQVLAEIV
jgi:biotin carboxyl carrier protein